MLDTKPAILFTFYLKNDWNENGGDSFSISQLIVAAPIVIYIPFLEQTVK